VFFDLFAVPAQEETVQRVAKRMRERNIEVVVVDDGAQARQEVLERLPKGAEVHSGKSKTLQDAAIFNVIHDTTQYDALRPRLFKMDRQTQRLIRSHLHLRRYELVTLAASSCIGCKYCMLAHGAVLFRNGFSEDQLISILRDFHEAGLEPAKVHMVDLSRKLSTEPRTVTAMDIQDLRGDGLTDVEITDVALVAAERNFYSRYFDALGAEPDLQLKEQVPRLWEYVIEPSHPSR
jgi:uncharacterized peroxidase-related enzyme